MTNSEFTEILDESGEAWQGESQPWDGAQLSRYFLRLTTCAQQHMWQLKDLGLEDKERQSDYDRALVVYSVCHPLWGQRFLWDREQLLSVMKELMGEVKADGVPFDRERFAERWRDALTALIERYA